MSLFSGNDNDSIVNVCREIGKMENLSDVIRERDALKEALSFYADRQNWKWIPFQRNVMLADNGDKARKALGIECTDFDKKLVDIKIEFM